MGYFEFGRKLFGSHVLITIIQIFLYFLIFGAFNNKWYEWLIGLLFIALFWFVIYGDASHYGMNDLKRGNFHPAKGFISGLIASIPGLFIYLITIALPDIWWLEVILRILLIPYIKFITTFDNFMPALAIIFIACFPVVSGLSYLDGIRRRDKIKEAIKKKDAMREELSKYEK